MSKTALITRITGQDGYYLSRLLLKHGYRVVGLVPPQRQSNLAKLGDLVGQVDQSPQDENTPFRPMNPYVAAKVHARWTMVHHRQRYDLFACSSILNWAEYVNVDPKLIRADEHFHLVANPAKAQKNLNWQPQISFEALIQEMILKDLERLKSGAVTPAAR